MTNLPMRLFCLTFFYLANGLVMFPPTPNTLIKRSLPIQTSLVLKFERISNLSSIVRARE